MFTALPVVLAAFPCLPQAPTQWPVNDSLSLQLALEQAADGDTILLEPAFYGADNLVLDGKGLVFAGTGGPGALVDIHSRIEIRNLAADQRVVFKDLRQVDALFATGAEFSDNVGPILYERVEYLGGPVGFGNAATFEIRNCDAVVFTDCTFAGKPATVLFGSPNFELPEPALEVQDSDVWIYNSEVRGGGSNQSCHVIQGQPAIVTSGSTTLTVFDSQLIAGSSTSQTYFGQCVPLDGSPAVRVDSGSLALFQTDSQLQGASGGGGAVCGPGVDGGEIGGLPGSFTQTVTTDSTPALFSPALVAPGAPFDLLTETTSGEVVLIAVSFASATPVDLGITIWLDSPLLALLPVGSADAGGQVSASFSAPALAGGLGPLQLFFQAASIDPVSLVLATSNPSSLTITE